MNFAGAEYSEVAIWLPGKGVFALFVKLTCLPWHCGEAKVDQSPASIAGVGTTAILLPAFWRMVVPWNPPKKNTLFLRIGPPRGPPNWLRFNPLFVEKYSRALPNPLFRKNSKRLP